METGRFVVHDGKMESGVESETGSYGQKRSFWLMELTVSKSAKADLETRGRLGQQQCIEHLPLISKSR
jgi:hypothetical protein